MIKYLIIIVIVVGLSITGILWNESRKEIVYLCANFSEGTEKESVLRQLNTGTWLTVEIFDKPDGSHLNATSAYNLFMYTCSIDFNLDDVVLSAKLI